MSESGIDSDIDEGVEELVENIDRDRGPRPRCSQRDSDIDRKTGEFVGRDPRKLGAAVQESNAGIQEVASATDQQAASDEEWPVGRCQPAIDNPVGDLQRNVSATADD